MNQLTDSMIMQMLGEADAARRRAGEDALAIGCTPQQVYDIELGAHCETIRSYLYQAGILSDDLPAQLEAQASAPQTWQPIAEIAVSIGDGLADWLEHRDDCVCLGDSGPHSPMCANCDCGLREALMAEAVSVASDDAVIAEVGGPEAVTKTRQRNTRPAASHV